MKNNCSESELKKLGFPLLKELEDVAKKYARQLEKDNYSNGDILDIICSATGILLTCSILTLPEKEVREKYLKHVIGNIRRNI